MPELKKSPSIKFHSKCTYFFRREGGSQNIIGTAVHTVAAVKNTLIGKKYLEEGNTSSIGGKAVADTGADGVADTCSTVASAGAA